KTAKYTLIQNDALLDQVPVTILTNPDYEFWFDRDSKTIVIANKSNGAQQFVINKTGVKNLQNGKFLVCLKKNRNHPHVQVLSKIESTSCIEFWCDPSDPNNPTFKFEMPRLGLSFTPTKDGEL